MFRERKNICFSAVVQGVFVYASDPAALGMEEKASCVLKNPRRKNKKAQLCACEKKRRRESAAVVSSWFGHIPDIDLHDTIHMYLKKKETTRSFYIFFVHDAIWGSKPFFIFSINEE